MHVLTNFPGSVNHLERLRQLATDADELIVFSPYLARDPGRLLEDLKLPGLRRFRLVTAMEPHAALPVQTVVALEEFRRYMVRNRNDVVFTVGAAERLHGKVYVLSQKQLVYAAIVTSANFTARGLNTNFEWGVELTDPDQVAAVVMTLDRLPRVEISHQQIRKMFAQVKGQLVSEPQTPATIPIRPLPVSKRPGRRTRERRIWIKPSGVSDNPVKPGDTRYKDLQVRLHFSKVRPSGLAIADILIVYGVGARQLMGLYEVSSAPQEITGDEIREDPSRERWPWYVEARNLTPLFSTVWWEHGCFISSVLEEFHRSYSHAPVTAVGGPTLGALSHGSDKIHLSPEFGAFLMEKLERIEDSLE